MMPTRVELLSVLGPLVAILPRVAVVMVAAMVALVSAGLCGRAVRDRRPVLFLAAWLSGLIGVLAARLEFASVVVYRWQRALSGGAAIEPLSVAGAADLLRLQLPFIIGAIGAGAVIASVLAWSRPRYDAGADAPFAPSQEARAARIGEVGERLVACELAALEWPALHNVILAGAGSRTVEIDHVVRAPDGIVVLETKTYSGFIAGAADAPRWMQHRAGGRQTLFLNPAIQNLSHVRTVERFVADPAVRVRGFVVSAGNARFDDAIAHIPVPLHALRTVLREDAPLVFMGQGRIDAAWRRLEREAARSAGRRAVHVAYARRRRRAAAPLA